MPQRISARWTSTPWSSAIVLLPIALVACGVPSRVVSRTADDLACPSDALHFEQVTDDSWEGAGATHRCTRYVATGCGKMATVDHFRSDDWVGYVRVTVDARPGELVACGAVP